jgi:phenylalanyl-tRNA synthetase beta chain
MNGKIGVKELNALEEILRQAQDGRGKMKISLNWIFDHIKGELARVDVAQLVEKFIRTTAEIEGWRKVTLNPDNLTLGEVVAVQEANVTVHSTERNKNYTLPTRADAIVGSCFMIADVNNAQKWATTTMFGGIKDMLLPALDVQANLRAGGWKSNIELDDYIIEIDNKSINSRPDLWGHRGIAREMAAILDLSLKSADELDVQKDIMAHESSAIATIYNPFDITIQNPKLCSRFAALYIPTVVPRASQLNMAIRLSRLDSRSIDTIVDATNYVMLDLGQPMHAFDADKFQSKKISIASGKLKEKLLLLDGETVELTLEDVVIADGGKAISLAGIMGGAQSGVSAQTKSLLLESATFDATTIRRTSARHKKRTEASMRFEKSLDPHQNIDALRRFLFLLNGAHVTYQAADRIVSLGTCPDQTFITVEHAFIEARLGIIIKPERVVAILERIAFQVEQSVEHDTVVYTIAVPSFRATKDIKIPEDIVEEIGRYIGYDALPRVMPALTLRPSDLHATYTTRAIKNFLSYGVQMHELYGYSFFDESVLREIAWQPTDFISIKNPISENYTRLVTTLQPHLLKAVADNSIHHTALRFYEWGRVWHKQGDDVIEQKSLSGIFYEQDVNFYTGKAMLVRLFEKLHMNVIWMPYNGAEFSWLSSYQTAALMHDDKQIGIAGMVDDATISFLSPAGGAAFIFEINGDYLLDYKKPAVRFEPLSKYPSVRRDVSMLISVSVTTDALIEMITSVDKRIEHVTLLDFFTKPEWKDRKAMTFHVEIGDKEKTLVADEVEEIWNKVLAQLQQQGAIIR